MMKYLLDTNICVALLRKNESVKQHLLKIGIDTCAISEITFAELLYGAYCSAKPEENIALVTKLCANFNIIPLSNHIAIYAEEKAKLRKQGNLIEDFDLLIGSAAISKRLILVTDNTKHLSRLPLKLENWINP